MDKLNLLIVDDDPEDVEILTERVRAALANSPFADPNIHSTSRLASALDAIQMRHERDDPFDGILLDLGLPDAQGLEALEAIHARTLGRTPIIVISGNQDEAQLVAALRIGAVDYLIKGNENAAALARSLNQTTLGRKISTSGEALMSIATSLGNLQSQVGYLVASSEEAKKALADHVKEDKELAGRVVTIERNVSNVRTIFFFLASLGGLGASVAVARELWDIVAK